MVVDGDLLLDLICLGMVQMFIDTASERRANNKQGFKDIYLKAKTIIWPSLPYMCRIHSTAVTRKTPGQSAVVSIGMCYSRCASALWPLQKNVLFNQIRLEHKKLSGIPCK